MKWGKDGKYDTLREFLDSEEGQKSIKDFADELRAKEDRKIINVNRMKRFYTTWTEFDSLMERLEARHGDRWEDVCYNQHVEPYPWETMYAVFNIAESEGFELNEPLDGLTANFPSVIYSYMGWQFAVTQGQGAVLSVYKDKELRFRI